MKKKFILGVIGAGFMSTAIINGIIKSKCLKSSQILVSDVNDDALKNISKLGVKTTKDNVAVCNNSEFYFLPLSHSILTKLRHAQVYVTYKRL